MQPLVQSATEAIQRGDKRMALDLLQQALSLDPRDVDALLALAPLVEEPTRQRQVLNRILSAEPTHNAARETLLEMDRAEMGAYRPASLSSTPSIPPTQPTPPASKPASAPTVKPLVFRYSTAWLVVLYLFTTIFCCAGLLVASQNIGNSLPSLALALLFGLSALSASSKVEVTQVGIRASAWLRSSAIQWDEIVQVRSDSFKRKLELRSRTGMTVNVSTQVKGYPVIVELLRQKRPDLFGEGTPAPAVHLSGSNTLESVVTPNPGLSFTGTKTFKKSVLKQYTLSLGVIPLILLMVWLGMASPELRTASFISAGFCLLVMVVPFFQVSAVKLEPNKLTIESFFEENEFSARQIKEIRMQSVTGRYGRVTNFINVIPAEGKKYPLGGFQEGDELVYGFLMNWWNQYQNR
jgi:hypothetical protein